jgi:hypothetical protein
VCNRQSVDLDKRILIQGQGQLGEASLDQRANSPAFRIRRAAVLRNIDIDMTGFREAVLVEGSATLRPLIDGCVIRRAAESASCGLGSFARPKDI